MPFVKGQSGNPAGRRPRVVEKKYHEILVSQVTEKDWGLIIKRAVNEAKAGDQYARKWLSDYLMGVPIQRTEVTGADGGALQHEVVSLSDSERIDRLAALLDIARTRATGSDTNSTD